MGYICYYVSSKHASMVVIIMQPAYLCRIEGIYIRVLVLNTGTSNVQFHSLGIAAICWAIWKTRNCICFEGKKIHDAVSILCHACALIKYLAALAEGSGGEAGRLVPPPPLFLCEFPTAGLCLAALICRVSD